MPFTQGHTYTYMYRDILNVLLHPFLTANLWLVILWNNIDWISVCYGLEEHRSTRWSYPFAPAYPPQWKQHNALLHIMTEETGWKTLQLCWSYQTEHESWISKRNVILSMSLKAALQFHQANANVMKRSLFLDIWHGRCFPEDALRLLKSITRGEKEK